MGLFLENNNYIENTAGTLFQLGAENGHYLIVSIENHEYGFGMNEVVKVVDCSELYRTSGVPNYIYGYLVSSNYSLPVIDLRARFDMGMTDFDRRCLVVVVNVEGKHVGMLVDYTCGIRKIPPQVINFSRKFITRIKKEYIKGMAIFNQNTFFVLEVSAISSLGIVDDHKLKIVGTDLSGFK